jgi:hypothetical protein
VRQTGIERFAYRWLPPSIKRSHLQLDDKSHVVDYQHYGPRQSPFGRVYYAPAGEVLFVPLFTPRKPPEALMLSIRQADGCCFLPGENVNDYQLVAQHLHLNDIGEHVLYWLLSHCDFAVVEANTAPIRLRSVAEAAEHNIPLEREEVERQNVSVWWQKWGGEVMTFQHDPQTGLVVGYDQLRRSVGKYKRLPGWLFK